MYANGIVVHWWFGDEYIDLDHSKVNVESRVSRTIQRREKTPAMDTYRTTTETERRPDGGLHIRILYQRSQNPEVPMEFSMWGTATLEFQPDAAEGSAVWEDSDNSEHNGKVTWEMLPKGIRIPERERRKAYSMKREKLLRDAVLSYETCCAITGESTLKALDAAHIIPVASRGADVVENAILLRADIHRLFDSGCFKLDDEGRVREIINCSDDYVALLTGKELSESVRKRVAEALKFQATQ